MKPKDQISLYIPARNAEATLADCVAAVKAQTRTPDEVFILADPRSTDGTLDIAIATGVPVILQQGATLGAARNEAVHNARYDWVACCDSDVIVAPDWLERLAQRRGENAVGIGGRTNERITGPADDWRAINMPHHWGEHAFRNPFMLVSEVLFRRDALLAIGGYRDDLNYYEDSDLCQRLRDAGYDLFYEPTATATHLRRDDLYSLLALRWKYSEYRQRDKLDRYAGLLQKLNVNREYALNTLSRLLARKREDLTYLSFLLYFHHALLDHRSLMSRRPMLSPAHRAFYETQLTAMLVGAVAARFSVLIDVVATDFDRIAPLAPSDERGDGVAPAWPSFLNEARREVEGFLSELDEQTLDVIHASARYVHGQYARTQVPRFATASSDSMERTLSSLGLRASVDRHLIRSIQTQWPDTSTIDLIGPASDGERQLLGTLTRVCTDQARGRVRVSAHLEACPNPLQVFHDAVDADHLVACYQPPTRFLPGIDVPSASDLASAASAAGWTIDRFETLVGRTQLMLSRCHPTSG